MPAPTEREQFGFWLVLVFCTIVIFYLAFQSKHQSQYAVSGRMLRTEIQVHKFEFLLAGITNLTIWSDSVKLLENFELILQTDRLIEVFYCITEVCLWKMKFSKDSAWL